MPAKRTGTRRGVRTVRIDDRQLKELLDRMDEVRNPEVEEKRQHTRYTYRNQKLTVHIRQPGSVTSVAFEVAPRNISAGGAAFLHGGYLHNGTVCVLELISVRNKPQLVPGTVVACHHVEGSIHEVCVQFRDLIDVGTFTLAAVNLRVLLVEDNDTQARLAKLYLSQLNARVQRVADGQAALDATLQTAYDLILLEMLLPEPDGFAVVRALRDRGYSGQIIALTALTEPADRQRCLTVGCNLHVPKPITRDGLASALQSAQVTPLFSSMPDEPELNALINDYVKDMPNRLRSLESALVAQDVTTLLTVVRRIRVDAGSFGFEPIAEEATELEKALHENDTMNGLRTQIEDLVCLCRSARGRGDQGVDEPSPEAGTAPGDDEPFSLGTGFMSDLCR